MKTNLYNVSLPLPLIIKDGEDDDYLDNILGDNSGAYSSDSAYDRLLDPSGGNSSGGDQAGPDQNNGKKKVDPNASLIALQNENKLLKQRIEQSTNGFETLKAKMDRLELALNPNTGKKTPEEIRLEKEALFDTDPTGFTEQSVKNVQESVVGYVDQQLAKRDTETAIKRFNLMWDVQWTDVNKGKVMDVLKTMTESYKNTNPVKALERAVSLAGVGKKRENPPMFEDSFINPEALRRKKEKTEVEEIRDSYMRGKDISTGGKSIDNLFKTIKK